MTKAQNGWVESEILQIERLEGLDVAKWIGVEIALRENPPIWDDVSIPYLQLDRLDAITTDGRRVHFTVYQDDDDWGLMCAKENDIEPLEPMNCREEKIFKTRILDNIPIGIIAKVTVSTSGPGNIEHISIVINDDSIDIRAGEVYETDGMLEIVFPDESILLQVNNAKPCQNRKCADLN